MRHEPATAVSFDFGQTLVELDTGLLSARLAERGVAAPREQLDAAVDEGWRAYNEAIHRGVSGHPWKIMMRRLLGAGGVAADAVDAVVDWLWTEQPRKNLWRRPIAGMIDVVIELRQAGVPVAVLSNSEGRLADLVDELGWSAHFLAVADSGRLGFEKPGREIFAWTAERLGASLAAVVHVGDSLAADVDGALAAGMRAVWFKGDPRKAAQMPDAERIAVCDGAGALRRALRDFGLRF
ncbi:haloacid dehalogenase [Sorangium cellulosum]|uniref:Haloacid dehalogenase n=1 Tax=Sorangium cellulosum TaxID=56 RepID=A0A4V0NET9_SORCE|nr:HAD family hydrolase [Sorangium cellulosum]AUX27332.1 haloacid dehalogenase [Sorangium cellulosum]